MANTKRSKNLASIVHLPWLSRQHEQLMKRFIQLYESCTTWGELFELIGVDEKHLAYYRKSHRLNSEIIKGIYLYDDEPELWDEFNSKFGPMSQNWSNLLSCSIETIELFSIFQQIMIECIDVYHSPADFAAILSFEHPEELVAFARPSHDACRFFEENEEARMSLLSALQCKDQIKQALNRFDTACLEVAGQMVASIKEMIRGEKISVIAEAYGVRPISIRQYLYPRLTVFKSIKKFYDWLCGYSKKPILLYKPDPREFTCTTEGESNTQPARQPKRNIQPDLKVEAFDWEGLRNDIPRYEQWLITSFKFLLRALEEVVHLSEEDRMALLSGELDHLTSEMWDALDVTTSGCPTELQAMLAESRDFRRKMG